MSRTSGGGFFPGAGRHETDVRAELLTWANLVTAVRLVTGLAAFGKALAGGPEGWIYAGLAIYWVGDLLDGGLARTLNQETILGAEFDILSDRIQICVFYLAYLSFHPDKTLVALVFLFEFMVLDHFLSNQFVRWPIRSPNYFYEVDRPTWWWLWSRPAKALNTGLVTLLTVGIESIWPPLAVATALTLVRVYFASRVLVLSAAPRAAARIPLPAALEHRSNRAVHPEPTIAA